MGHRLSAVRGPRLLVSLVGERCSDELRRFGGVGLVRGEFFQRRMRKSIVLDEVREHIRSYLEELCAFMEPAEVWYRLADLCSDEANPLEGVPVEIRETNPLIGVRGARRLLRVTSELRAECEMLASVAVRNANLGVIVPYVTDDEQFGQVVKALRGCSFHGPIASMIETPASVLLAGRIVDAGADRLLIGVNDLSCLATGTSRAVDDDARLHPAVRRLVDTAVSAAAEGSVECGLAGAVSPAVLDMAAEAGVDYVSVPYWRARALLDPSGSRWTDEDLERQIKDEKRRASTERTP